MKLATTNKTAFLTVIFMLLCVFSFAESLSLSKTVVDFGTLKLKDRKTANVTLKNLTEKPIIIKDVDVACNCTKTSYSKRPIMPKDSTILKITFDAKETGVFYKKVIISHSAEEQFSTITLRGTIK